MENNDALKLDDTLEEELEEIHVDVPNLISLITSLCKSSLNKATATALLLLNISSQYFGKKDYFIKKQHTKFNITLHVPVIRV